MKSFLPLIRAEWPLLLFGFAMTFSSSLGQTYFIGLFSGEIRADMQLSHGRFGAIYSTATLASALLLLWTGSLIDRLDLRVYAYGVTAGLGGACVLMAASQGPALLFISVFALRHLGQGLMSMAGATSVVRYLDHARGKANALAGMGYSISEAILPSIAISLLAVFSWREAWLAWAGLLLVVVPALIHVLLKGHDLRHARYTDSLNNSGTNAATVSQKQWTRAEVVRDLRFYLFLPALLAQPLLFTGFMFHQVHLVEQKGWSLAAWGSLFVFYAAVNTVFKLAAGLLIDHFGAVRLVPLICLPLGAGLLLLAGSDHFAAGALFMGLMAISIGVYSTLSSPFFSEMYGTKHLGSIKSVTTASMVFATAVTPVLMGWLIDWGASMNTMALMGAGYVAAASFTAYLGARMSV